MQLQHIIANLGAGKFPCFYKASVPFIACQSLILSASPIQVFLCQVTVAILQRLVTKRNLRPLAHATWKHFCIPSEHFRNWDLYWLSLISWVEMKFVSNATRDATFEKIWYLQCFFASFTSRNGSHSKGWSNVFQILSSWIWILSFQLKIECMLSTTSTDLNFERPSF